MAANLEIQVNQVLLEKALKSLQSNGKAIGLTVQHLMWEVAADAAKNAQKYTAPWAQGNTPTNAASARKTGEGAIAYDMTWKGLDTDSGLLSFMDDFKVNKNFGEGYQSLESTNGAFFLVPNEYILESESDIEHIHTKFRNRKGRVQFRGISTREKIGNREFAVKRHYFSRKNIIESFIKKVQTRVGELKSGWNNAILYFCGKVGKKTGLSSWISRHNERCIVNDGMRADGNGEISFENKAEWVNAIRPDTIAFVQRQANKDIQKYLPLRLEKIAKRISNFETANGAEI